MGQTVQSPLPPRRPYHHVVQTFPLCSLRHECYEDITKVDFMLTEPSQKEFHQNKAVTQLSVAASFHHL
jgi:hypothetical protein